MTSMTVEVREAGERLHELADAVLQGCDVWITDRGEPVALATLEYLADAGPPPGLRQAVLALIEGAVNHLRRRPQPHPWFLN